MRYLKEKDLFTVKCTHSYGGDGQRIVIPKDCPCGNNLCLKAFPYPIVGYAYVCPKYLRMADYTPKEVFRGTELYCRGLNSIKFMVAS